MCVGCRPAVSHDYPPSAAATMPAWLVKKMAEEQAQGKGSNGSNVTAPPAPPHANAASGASSRADRTKRASRSRSRSRSPRRRSHSHRRSRRSRSRSGSRHRRSSRRHRRSRRRSTSRSRSAHSDKCVRACGHVRQLAQHAMRAGWCQWRGLVARVPFLSCACVVRCLTYPPPLPCRPGRCRRRRKSRSRSPTRRRRRKSGFDVGPSDAASAAASLPGTFGMPGAGLNPAMLGMAPYGMPGMVPPHMAATAMRHMMRPPPGSAMAVAGAATAHSAIQAANGAGTVGVRGCRRLCPTCQVQRDSGTPLTVADAAAGARGWRPSHSSRASPVRGRCACWCRRATPAGLLSK